MLRLTTAVSEVFPVSCSTPLLQAGHFTYDLHLCILSCPSRRRWQMSTQRRHSPTSLQCHPHQLPGQRCVLCVSAADVHVCIFTLSDSVTRCCCSGLAFPGQTCMNFSNSLTLSKTKTSHVLSPPPSELNQQQWISVQFPVSCKDMISVGWFVVVYYYSP